MKLRFTRLAIPVAAAMGLALAVPPAQAAEVSVTDGLVAHWTFDETSGFTAADSVAGNNGTLLGYLTNAGTAKPSWTTGKVGGALQFNTTTTGSYVKMASYPPLPSDYTISAWVNYSLIGSAYSWQTIAKNWGSTVEGEFHFGLDQNGVSLSNYLGGGRTVYAANPGLTTGTWYHLAVTVGGGSQKLYVNGTQVASAPFSGALQSRVNNGAMSVGVKLVNDGSAPDFTINPGWFRGTMDDLAIWNRVISAEEVAAVASATGDVTTARVTVPDPVPDAPSAPTAVAGDGSATVTVNPASTGGPATSYTVTASPGGATCQVPATADPLSCQISGLSNGTAYTFTTTATNASGTSGASVTSAATVPMPAGPNLVPNADFELGNTGFTSSYTYQSGGNPALDASRYSVAATGRDVHIDFDGTTGDHTSGSGLYFIANGATDTSQTVWQADNIRVTSGSTYRFEAWIKSEVRLPYAMPSLKFQVGVPQPDGSTVWSDITPAQVYDSLAWENVFADWVSTHTGPVSIRLVNGSAEAVGNDFGIDDIFFGLAADSPSALNTPDAPAAPAAVAGDGTAVVSVSPNAAGATPTKYVVTASPGGASCEIVPPATSCTISGLTNATEYTFTAAAYNGSLGSAASSASDAVTPLPAPGAPSAPGLLYGDGSLRAILGTGEVGSGTVRLVYTASPGGASCEAAPGFPCTITGLENYAEYTVTAVAYNANGTPSAASAGTVGMPRPVPSAPTTAPVVVSTTATTINVRVNDVPPAREDVASWWVYADSSSGGVSTKCLARLSGGRGSLARLCTLSGLTPGGGYVLTSTARNNTGESLGRSPATAVSLNTAPTVAVAPVDANGSEGDVLGVSGRFADSAGDVLTITASPAVGELTSSATGEWSWSLATTDDVPAGTVTVTATDSFGASVSTSFSYSAGNVAPAATATLTSTAYGCSATVAGTLSDPGSADTHTGLITWGDGSSTDAVLAGTHSYAAAGTYPVTVTVTDDNGGSATALSTTHTVSNRAAWDKSVTGRKVKIGSAIDLKVAITDCLGAAVPGLSPKVYLVNSAGAQIPAVATSKKNTGNVMRYHAEGDDDDEHEGEEHEDDDLSTYKFELTTKGLAAGTWQILVTDASLAAPLRATVTLSTKK